MERIPEREPPRRTFLRGKRVLCPEDVEMVRELLKPPGRDPKIPVKDDNPRFAVGRFLVHVDLEYAERVHKAIWLLEELEAEETDWYELFWPALGDITSFHAFGMMQSLNRYMAQMMGDTVYYLHLSGLKELDASTAKELARHNTRIYPSGLEHWLSSRWDEKAIYLKNADPVNLETAKILYQNAEKFVLPLVREVDVDLVKVMMEVHPKSMDLSKVPHLPCDVADLLSDYNGCVKFGSIE